MKVCVLKVQRWRENGGQQKCIRTHTCTRTRKHMYINTHTTHTRTHAHVHTHTHTARSSICPMTARLRTCWAESHSCPSSGYVPPSRISSSMQPRQNVWPHLTEMTGSRNTRLQAGQTRAGGSSTNLVGLAAISRQLGRRAAQPRAREGSRGVEGTSFVSSSATTPSVSTS